MVVFHIVIKDLLSSIMQCLVAKLLEINVDMAKISTYSLFFLTAFPGDAILEFFPSIFPLHSIYSEHTVLIFKTFQLLPFQ